jgi:diguanylate cyclase (GGDEF)-like protein
MAEATSGRWRRLALLALVVVAPYCASASPAKNSFDFGERVLESVGDQDEIPSGVITALAQGADGFLWIGTQKGLLRFDGYRFRRYAHAIDDPRSMAGDFIFSMAVAADGRVWVGHEVDGVSVLDPASETFERFRHDPAALDGIGPGNIYAIAAHPDGGVYIAGDSRLTRYDLAQRRFDEVVLGGRGAQSEPSERVRSLLVGRDGTLWIGTQDGVLRKRAGHFAAESLLTVGGESLAGREVVALCEGWNGALWVGTRENGAAVVDPASGAIRWIGREHAEADALSRSWINAIAQVSADEIWLSRYGAGIALVDARSLAITHLLTQDASVKDGLSFDAAGAFQVDPAGLLWVGSWGGGLQRHNPRNAGLRLLRHSALRAGKLSYPNLLSVLELRDGRVLAGTTQNGIDIIDPLRGVIGGWRVDPEVPGGLSDGVIGGLAEAADGTLWVGTFQSGVHRLNPGATRFRHYTREHGLPTLQIEVTEVSRDGRVWIGTGDGLVRYAPERDRFVDVLAVDGQAPRTRFNGMAEAADGRLWFGSANGLYVLDPGAERLRHFMHDPKDARSLGNDVVANVVVDQHGTVWANTQLGLERVRGEPGAEWFEHVSPRIGMPGESLGSNLLEDAQGRLWTNTAVFDPRTLKVSKLHRADGLDVGTNWVGSAAKTRSGLLLYGGTNGLGIVDPARYVPWSHPPRVLITDVTVDGMRRPQAAVQRQLELAPDEARFDIEFSADDFSAPAANRYAYRLLGNGTAHWVEVDADHRHASFGNLWPGEYTLEVRATNRVGEVSREPARVAIRVLPKYWQRPLFVLALGLFALLVLFLLVRVAVAQYRRRALLLQALVDERTAALRGAYAEVERASRTDPLTGLGNRRSLEQALPLLAEQVLGARGEALQRRRLALILVDIDEFKQVNDQHGHAAGDRVIVSFAQLIRAQLRDGDIGVRWGGEEFLIVAQVGDEDEALHCAERLREAVAAHAFVLDSGVTIGRTCSIGFALLPFSPQAREALAWTHVLEIADAALFEAKHDGRDRVYGYAADGQIESGFIERFRATDPARRHELPLRRLASR